VVHACRETLGDELIEQWRAHLCGLCLSLRDSRGQLARALTNTDAVMLSVLVEAQHSGMAERTTAGPCPLRGMRPAQVVPTDAAAARLGAKASLTLAAAKARDVTAEQEHQLTPPTLRNQAIGLLAGPLRRAALADAPMATAVHAGDVLDDLAQQGVLEAATRIGDNILTVTAPTSRAAGRIFSSSAALAERPQNADALRDIGMAFGSLAHLLDAVEDLDADRRSGSFNPIIATGTPLPAVRRHCTALVRRTRTTFDRLDLSDGRLARALLVDGTHRAAPGISDAAEVRLSLARDYRPRASRSASRQSSQRAPGAIPRPTAFASPRRATDRTALAPSGRPTDDAFTTAERPSKATVLAQCAAVDRRLLHRLCLLRVS